MDTEPGTTRWWEYYLPRYLMPSVAGVVIVNWLCSYAGDEFRSLLSLPLNGKPLESSSLILLFLYGNLFCYVASYPVLVFHATRVMDFSKGKWSARFADGYIMTTILVAAIFFLHFVPLGWRYWLAFVVAFVFMIAQLGRIRLVLSDPFKVKGHGDVVTAAYLYSYVLAHRRGMPVVEEEIKTSSPNNTVRTGQMLPSEDEEDKEEIETTRSRTNLWRREFMDTYRHLREHGNSAFIFLLEIVLAALTYCILTKPGQSATQELEAIGLLFVIWAMPSAFVHLLAQHLERRFSRYEQKVKSEMKHS